MTSERAQEVVAQLAGIRRRIDELRDHWDAPHREMAMMVGALDELSVSSAPYPSVEALLFCAARLIERGEPAGHRLEKLCDHLHGYMVGCEDAAQVDGLSAISVVWRGCVWRAWPPQAGARANRRSAGFASNTAGDDDEGHRAVCRSAPATPPDSLAHFPIAK